ncbi:MAG: PKD domain-containing protein [Flavobacteriales bacterium]|nr:PKD domain-containing protein [Flavobacteriales bacterium]
MKRFLTPVLRSAMIAVAMVAFLGSQAQVDVSGALVGNGTYGTLGAAFTAINGGAQTGANILIEITGNTTEPASATLNAGAWATVTINPSGGATRTISGNLAAPLINLNGADNVTIDGLNSGGNALVIENTSSAATAGTSAVRFIADAVNNVVRKCTIRGSNTTGAAGNGTIFFSTGTSTGNDNNLIEECVITAAGSNLPQIAISSTGTSVAVDNSGNTVSGCEISDYFNASTASTGLYLVSNSSGWTISDNKFFQTATRTATSGAIHRAIYINTASGSGYSITGNTIGFANTVGTGTTSYAGAIANRFIGIECVAAATPVSSIQGNTVAGISLATTSGATTTPGVFGGIVANAGVNIGTVTGNTIGAATGTGSIAITSSTGGGRSYGIYATSSTGAIDIRNNTVAGITYAGATAAIGTNLNAIEVNAAGSGTTLNIVDNQVGSATAGSLTIGLAGTTTGTCSLLGIASAGAAGTVNISNNVLRGVTMHSTTSNFIGIQSTGNVSVANNITDNQLGNAGAGVVNFTRANSGTFTGITVTSGTSASSLSITGNDLRGVVYDLASSGANTYVSNTGAVLNTNISSNTFTNLSVNTTGNVTFISNSVIRPANAVTNVNNNGIVTGFSKTGSGGAVQLYLSNSSTPSTGSDTNTGNDFSNITLTGATSFAGWQNTDGSTFSPYGPQKNVSNNTFSNIILGSGASNILQVGYSRTTATNTVANNAITNISGTGSITAINMQQGPHDITGNTIRGITSTGTAAEVIGIRQAQMGVGTMNIRGNLIADMQSGGTTAGLVRGIDLVGGTSGTTTNVVNNRIGDLRMPACNSTTAFLHGFHANMGTTGFNISLSYNTIYLSATSSGASFTTAAVYCNTAPTLTMRNNILVNMSTPNGAGNRTIAYRQAATGLTNYGAASNNNLFYADTPGPTRVIHWNGTTAYETLASWQAFASPRDANSVSELPPFLSTDPTNADYLKIDPTVATQIESGGIAIAGIDDDFEGDIRFGSVGYTGGGAAPDIGADEFEGVLLDIAAPIISYTPLSSACGTGARTLSASITDASGVPTSGDGLPRLRWRINAGAWAYVTGVHISGSTYEFTFGASAAEGDVVEYYVVAQDNAGTPNVGAFPAAGAGGFGADPPAASTPPTTPSSYTVLAVLAGTYNVGSGEPAPFNSLPSAIAHYHASCLGGAVVYQLMDASYPLASTLAINNHPDASSVNTLTIRPNAATAVLVSGTIASNPLINMNGARFVIFDGLNTGGATLTIRNASTSAGTGTSTIRFINDAVNDTIRNCTLEAAHQLGGILESGVLVFAGGATTGNDDIVIANNIIGAVSGGTVGKAIYGNGSTGSLAVHNSGVRILDNEIRDYFLPAATHYGLFLNTGCTNWTISGNKFYQTAARVTSTTSAHRMLEINTASFADVGGYDISGNTFGFANASGTGIYDISGTNGSLRAIHLGLNSGNTVLTNIDGNIFGGISLGTTTSGTTSNSPFQMIFVNSGLVNIGVNAGNIIGSQTANSLSFTTTSSSSTDVYAIHNFSLLPTTISNNVIGGITANLGTSSLTSILSGITVNTSSSVASTVSNNTVGGTVAHSIRQTGATTGSVVRGIAFVTSSATVADNLVRNLSNDDGQAAVGAASAVTGLWFGSTGVNHTVSRNTVHSLRSTNAAGTRAVLGMYYTSSSGTNIVERNLIHSLDAAATGATLVGINIAGGTTTYRNNMIRLGVDAAGASITVPLTINGIWDVSGATSLHHNSVYIGGSGVGGTANDSWCLYTASSGPVRNWRNNIFHNARSNAGAGGKHYAIRAISVSGLTSNYNLLYASGNGGVLGFFSFDRPTLASWQLIGQDANSVTGDPRYINPEGDAATLDLHIDPVLPTPIEGTGVLIATVTDDFDAETRSGLTPTDIGADAGDFVFGEATPPTIVYTPLTTPSCDLSTRVLTATITDASGVPTAGVGLPRLRWRVNAGAWNYETAVWLGGDNYEFTFAPGLVSADVVEYYVVAQDNNDNVGTFPAGGGGFSANPPAASVPPPASVLNIGLILNGTYLIGNAQPPPFNTLRTAIDGYNNACLTGPVIYELVDASYTTGTGEVFPIAINNNVDASATNTFTIRPAAGNAATVQGTLTGGPMIDLFGARYVTFDGLMSGGASLTIANTSTAATSGTSTMRFASDAVFNTITRCAVQGSSTSAAGTNGGNIWFGANSSSTGNDNNTVSLCDIGPAGGNLPSKGIYFTGTSNANPGTGNSGNVIDNNNIFDVFHPTVSTAFIDVNSGTPILTITNNRMYQTATRTITDGSVTITHHGIRIANTNGNGYTVTGNTIGHAAADGTGTYNLVFPVSGSCLTSFVPILVNVGITTASNVDNNIIRGIAMSGAGCGTGTTAVFRGIYITAGLTTCNGNTVGSTTSAASITLTSTSASAADVTAIYNFGSSDWTTNNNQIGGITTGGGTGARNFYGLRCNTTSSNSWTANNNTIGGTVANSIESASTSTAALMRGILVESPSASLSGNLVRNLNAAGGTGTFVSASVIGVSITASSANHTLSGNAIHSLSNTNATGTRHVLGIHFNASTGTNLLEKNLVHSLNLASTGGTLIGINNPGGTVTIRNNMVRLGIDQDGNDIAVPCFIYGIWDQGGTRNIWHNSVYIGGADVSSGASETFAIYADGASTRSYRNNILFNARSNAASGANHYAIRMSTLTGLTSDHNNLHVSGNGGHIGFFTSARLTLNDWRTATSGRDVNSPGGNPQFIAPNGTAATVDLHIHPTNPTPIEGTGFAVAVTDDFDGEDRSALTPVDIGADAGDFVFGDLEPPTITYTPLGSPGCVTGMRSLDVTITDVGSGVPTTGIGQPVLYWRINGGGWTGETATTISAPTFTFQFGAGTNGGDLVEYYVAAQDGSDNVTTEPFAGASGFTADPPAVSTAPTTPSSYSINWTLNGTYAVGTAQAAPFNTLTGAIGAYNAACLTGPVVFELEDATYSTGETFPITIAYNADASSTNTLTIQPAASVTPTITGSSTGAILLLNGADWIRIEGSNAPVANGLCQTNSARHLTISNTSTGTSSAVIWLQSAAGPAFGATNNIVRNCIVTGNSSTTTLMGIGSGSATIGTGSLGVDNDGNTFENNAVSSCQIGIYSVGASAANKNEGTAIRFNNLNTHGTAGIFARFENSIGITGNNVDGVFRTGALDVMGISVGFAHSSITATEAGVGEVTNATITHNTIGSVVNNNQWSAVGIAYGAATTGSSTIANNTVSGVAANATNPDISAGILLGGGAATVNVYHNTVRMQGTIPGTTAATQTAAALAMVGAGASTDIRNNILVNTQQGNAGASLRFTAIALGHATYTFTSNNNDLFAGGGGPGTYTTGITGGIVVGTSRVTLAIWQGITGKDLLSQNVSPAFVSATDLHLSPTSAVNGALVGTGANVGIAIDIDCETRPALPTIGADEFRAIYYSQATGDVNAPIWDVVPVGTAGPAIWGAASSMVVQNPHLVTNTADVDVRDLTVDNGGTLTLTTNTTLTVNGASASFTGAGAVVAEDDSELKIAGVGAFALSTTANLFLFDLTVDRDGTTTVSGSVRLQGTLLLEDGDFDATTANVRLRSNVNGTGRLGPVGTNANYLGDLRVARWMPNGATNWRLMGSPVLGATVQQWDDNVITGGFPGSDYPNFDNPVGSGILWPSVRLYAEETEDPDPLEGLVSIENVTSPLVAGRGYAIWCGNGSVNSNPFQIDVTGPPRIAKTPFTLPMTWTESTPPAPAADGWNLVSNPLASPIDFDLLSLGGDVEEGYYIYNPDDGTTAYWDAVLGTSFPNGVLNGVIQSSQGFWLKANGGAVTTTVDESAKVAGNSGGLWGAGEEVADLLRLRVTGDQNAFNDEAAVLFAQGSPAFGPGDAAKMPHSHLDAPRIATHSSDGHALVLNRFGAYTSDITIPVSIRAGVAGTYTITFTHGEMTALGCLRLEDLETGIFTPVVDGESYTFTQAATGEEAVMRFVLHAATPLTLTTQNAICGGTATGEALVDLGSQVANVTWSDGFGNPLLVQNGITGQAVFAGLQAGEYSVLVEVDGCGPSEQTFLITAPEVMSATVETLDATCPDTMDGQLSVDVLGGALPYTYLWSNGATEASIAVVAGNYSVIVTDAQGCDLEVGGLVVGSGPAPEAAFEVEQTTVVINTPVHFTNTSVGGAGYLWDFGDGASSTEVEPTHTYTMPGVYTVTLTAFGGVCSISWSMDIVVELGTGLSDSMLPGVNAWGAEGLFFVEHGFEGGTLYVEVLDAAGKLHRQWNLGAAPGRVTLPADGLSTGIWLLRVTHGHQTRTFRIPLMR